MSNKKVKLLRYAKTPQGWKRGIAIIGKTGKVKPDHMIYKGQEIYCPDGYYITRAYLGKHPKYKDVGNDAAEALSACKREQDLIELSRKLQRHGLDLLPQPEKVSHMALHELRDSFLEEKSLEPHRSVDSMSVYRNVATAFVKSCGKSHPEQIDARDILRYCAKLEENGNSERTRANRYGTLCTFLRYCKIDPSSLLTSLVFYDINGNATFGSSGGEFINLGNSLRSYIECLVCVWREHAAQRLGSFCGGNGPHRVAFSWG